MSEQINQQNQSAEFQPDLFAPKICYSSYCEAALISVVYGKQGPFAVLTVSDTEKNREKCNWAPDYALVDNDKWLNYSVFAHFKSLFSPGCLYWLFSILN